MAARAGVAAAVYVSPEVYSLPVYQEFASLRPPLGGCTRLVDFKLLHLTAVILCCVMWYVMIRVSD